MTHPASCLFSLSYEKRNGEKEFIKDILLNFNNGEITSKTILVDNNIYHLDFLLLLTFENENKRFDSWLSFHYPKKKYNYLFNYSLEDILNDQLDKRRYLAYSFRTVEQALKILTGESNDIFRFPCNQIIETKSDPIENALTFKTFLSYSYKDKEITEKLFLELQKEGIKTWFDKADVDYGDCITDKINEGLKDADLGILVLSKNFLNTNWGRAEANYFFRRQLESKKVNFIIISINLSLNDLPPLFQDYRYIKAENEGWLEELIIRIKELSLKKINKYSISVLNTN